MREHARTVGLCVKRVHEDVGISRQFRAVGTYKTSVCITINTIGFPPTAGITRQLLMTEPQFIVADIRLHRAELLELNVEYVSWVFSQVDEYFRISSAEVVGMQASAYVETIIDKICDQHPPDGIFYLVKVEGMLAAMGGLRRLNPNTVEVKRIYVRPACRGLRLGERILTRLLADAKSFGYRKVCLDTGPFMKSAHKIYENSQFVDRAPYLEAEVPVEFHDRWRFMERPIGGSISGPSSRLA